MYRSLLAFELLGKVWNLNRHKYKSLHIVVRDIVGDTFYSLLILSCCKYYSPDTAAMTIATNIIKIHKPMPIKVGANTSSQLQRINLNNLAITKMIVKMLKKPNLLLVSFSIPIPPLAK